MELPSVIRTYIEAYNHKDVDSLVNCVTDDVVFENVSNAGPSMRVVGRDAFARLAHQAAEMFTSRRQTVRSAVVAGDNVALELDWIGIPAIDMGAAKAGDQMAMRGASFFTIADGKLASIIDLS